MTYQTQSTNCCNSPSYKLVQKLVYITKKKIPKIKEFILTYVTAFNTRIRDLTYQWTENNLQIWCN